MILDTTYFLPLIGIDIDTNLLKAIDNNKAILTFGDISLSLVTIFELQAKAAKLGISHDHVINGINAILKGFNVIPFFESDIIRTASELRKKLNDYIDCIIVASAVHHGGKLVTEDKGVLSKKGSLKKTYGIQIYTYKELLK